MLNTDSTPICNPAHPVCGTTTASVKPCPRAERSKDKALVAHMGRARRSSLGRARGTRWAAAGLCPPRAPGPGPVHTAPPALPAHRDTASHGNARPPQPPRCLRASRPGQEWEGGKGRKGRKERPPHLPAAAPRCPQEAVPPLPRPLASLPPLPGAPQKSRGDARAAAPRRDQQRRRAPERALPGPLPEQVRACSTAAVPSCARRAERAVGCSGGQQKGRVGVASRMREARPGEAPGTVTRDRRFRHALRRRGACWVV